MKTKALLLSTLMMITLVLPLPAIGSGSSDDKCKTETIPGCGKPRP